MQLIHPINVQCFIIVQHECQLFDNVFESFEVKRFILEFSGNRLKKMSCLGYFNLNKAVL